MKRFLFSSFIAIVMLSSSCTKENISERDLDNKWHLIETLNDPGDGSGTFQRVDSDAIIEFFDDDTVRYSKSFCGEENSLKTGRYSSVENEIYPDCDPNVSFSYKIENNQLIIYYNCIEGCAEKFELIK